MTNEELIKLANSRGYHVYSKRRLRRVNKAFRRLRKRSVSKAEALAESQAELRQMSHAERWMRQAVYFMAAGNERTKWG